ncbi:MAG TPA: adenylate/guanylate cyclase domain-containing protein [Paracoccaceae bacterium]|nr:adenylate/guanylate cyclase domain-containing protein [Paracoccaceae bacterium]
MLALLDRFAFDPDDSDDVRSEKNSIFLVAASCCFFGLIWSAIYFSVFGANLTAALPLVFGLIVGPALVLSHITRNHRIAIHAQIVCIVYVTTFIQWSIGDVFDSGFVMIWAILGPLIALMFFSIFQAAVWQGLFLLNIVIGVIFNDFFAAHGETVTQTQRLGFVLMNLGAATGVVFAFAAYFVRNALSEKQKADSLLRNILPEKIARKLKRRDGEIAEAFENVSVLFADIVDYTSFSSDKDAAVVVAKLNEIFRKFDELVDFHGLEKIKTIGDAYMVAGGLPERSEWHERAVANMALDMMAAVKEVRHPDGGAFSLRIGIHTGPVVAGVIGTRKFAYDLWGDTVNVASRLESNGVSGRIQVSDMLRERLGSDFVFEDRGTIMLKGKGEMKVHFLLGIA